MNSIETWRIEMGLSRRNMLQLLGSRPYRLSLFNVPDEDTDKLFLARAEVLVNEYREYADQIKLKLDAYEAQGLTELSMSQLSDLTGVREVYLVRLRFDHVFGSVKRGKGYFYPIEEIRKLVVTNSTRLLFEDDRQHVRSKPHRGPLSLGFVRWRSERVPAA